MSYSSSPLSDSFHSLWRSLAFSKPRNFATQSTKYKFQSPGFPRWLSGKEPACQCWRRRFNPWEDPLKEEMTTHSGILTWEIPWTEEPGGLQSMGSQTVRQDSATK